MSKPWQIVAFIRAYYSSTVKKDFWANPHQLGLPHPNPSYAPPPSPPSSAASSLFLSIHFCLRVLPVFNFMWGRVGGLLSRSGFVAAAASGCVGMAGWKMVHTLLLFHIFPPLSQRCCHVQASSEALQEQGGLYECFKREDGTKLVEVSRGTKKSCTVLPASAQLCRFQSQFPLSFFTTNSSTAIQ